MLHSLQEIEYINNKHMCLDRYSIQKKRARKLKAPKPNLVEEKQILAELVL